ncbi:flagellar basal body rod protein FlgF [Acetobacter estunensis NRIC 0472]|uniref:Flagellar basal-body rod protein FlgF n=1 Tax=Acetobacter estunensis TaxID=104097 RepID=A0A967B404_9PROT|nr:flagellar basal-body rod protein FlgF [Acetobacter estunensis]MBV1836609.1 flagellar basal-body rod protein FlgF [Acetobacter estunensis]NHO53330.1 flagellar basal-body rod protein FlgF [Acetobacter estunensis]GBQ22083.1 flagellar basal body rod protein FlgF [Acetobacter estunensis NRIC 0472]
MDNTTYIALSRMDAETRAMSVLANNLANGSTPGFKAGHLQFSDYLVKAKGGTPAPGESPDTYTQDRATWRDFSQGALQQTGNPLDLAISGEGYFSVMTANGVRLTRNGRFQKLSDGSVTDAAGNALLDRTGQPIVLRPEDRTINISADGTISTESRVVAELGLVNVANPHDLSEEGDQLFRAKTPTTQMEVKEFRQGMIEGSNVNTMTEMTNLVQLQRDFQITANLVDSESTRRQNAIDKIIQTQS